MDDILKAVEERWDTHAGNYDARHNGSAGKEENELWWRYLETHIGEGKEQKVLDVGAGSGFLALRIAALGYECQGVDISEGMMALGKKHAADRGLNLEFMRGDLVDLPFADESRDVVCNRHILWTLLEPAKAFKEWLRVLKPGGKLLCFCSVGGDSSFNHYSQEIEDMLGLKGASVSKLCRSLEDAGFVAVEAVILEDLHMDGKNRFWYVIKGRKAPADD